MLHLLWESNKAFSCFHVVVLSGRKVRAHGDSFVAQLKLEKASSTVLSWEIKSVDISFWMVYFCRRQQLSSLGVQSPYLTPFPVDDIKAVGANGYS